MAGFRVPGVEGHDPLAEGLGFDFVVRSLSDEQLEQIVNSPSRPYVLRSAAQQGPIREGTVLLSPLWRQKALSELERREDEREFKLIRTYGVKGLHEPPYQKRKGESYKAYESAETYIRHREGFFGSRQAYEEFSDESDEEFERLRRLIEPPRGGGSQELSDQEKDKAKMIMYRWLRKACKVSLWTDKEDIAAEILAAEKRYEDLKAELQQFLVRADQQSDPRQYAYVPRPVKMDNRYLIGTVSDHTPALAIDVEWARNKQMSPPEWRFIHWFVGMQELSDTERKQRWSGAAANAESLWKYITELNKLYTAKVSAEVRMVSQYQTQEHQALENVLRASASTHQESHGLGTQTGHTCKAPPSSLTDDEARDLLIEAVASGGVSPEEARKAALLLKRTREQAAREAAQSDAMERQHGAIRAPGSPGRPSSVDIAMGRAPVPVPSIPKEYLDVLSNKQTDWTKLDLVDLVLEVALMKYQGQKPNKAKLKEYAGGFFSLPWKLVGLFHANGCEWGATYSTPDLHHFKRP